MLKKFRNKVSQKHESPANALINESPSPERHNLSVSSGSNPQKWDRRRSSGPKDALAAARRPSQLSAASSHRRTSPASQDAKNKTLGLRVVHQPGPSAPLDIIFVHGLGGNSQKTWSKNHDPELFWPGLWLPHETDIGKARILSFGYNADFRPGAGRSIANIADFAKELLFEMRFGRDESGDDLRIGKVPIIFVVHSMGGLVVKKCYLLGQNDEACEEIIQSISAIIFLATPHRGSGLAETLSKILSVSFQAPKAFIADLAKGSPMLEEINESFRHVASKLSIWSFYETLTTKIGLQQTMIVEKDSAVLGYPKEISRSLNADHHDVCKYSSPEDSNYIIVRNALKTLVEAFRTKGANAVSEQMMKDTKEIKQLLAITSGMSNDFRFFHQWWVSGTCQWLLEEKAIRLWLEDEPKSYIVWYSAQPGSGKSILAAFAIDYLRSIDLKVQYFFFRFGDQSKRTLSTCLRTIAYQLANDIPAFGKKLKDLCNEGLRLDKAEASFIWQKLFEDVLFAMPLPYPLYWVIDALDESDTPKALLELLRSLPRSEAFVRLLIISRKTEALSIGFERLSSEVTVSSIQKFGREHNASDIHALIGKEMKAMRGSDHFKRSVQQSIMKRADGNFLWVRLVIEEVLSCHTEEAVQETLDEIPGDMTLLYERMEATIINNGRISNRKLAKSLLQWAICGHRSLTLKELSGALPEFLDLRRTIHDVCGQFIIIDQSDNVGMIHQTARDYLTQTSSSEISINTREGHEELCSKTVTALLDPELRLKLAQSPMSVRENHPFVVYAATSWTYHLGHSSALSKTALNVAVKFLSGAAVLTWIYALAVVGRLEILVKAAKVFTSLINTQRKSNLSKNPMLHRLTDLDLLEQWSVDLVKVVGKFSRHLLMDPQAIYKIIPPMCPTKSILYRQFHGTDSARVSVSGIVSSSWDDNLIRMVLPGNDQGHKIICAGPYLAVLGSFGTTYIWNSYDFAEVCTLRHGEPVTAVCLNKKGDRLATYGLKSTKHWSTPSGQLLDTIDNIPDIKAMALEFADKDRKILAGTDDRIIRYLQIDDLETGWRTMTDAPAKETSDIEGSFINSPMFMGFNGDRTQVGISYRGFPLTVWSLTQHRCIGRSKRSRDFRSDGARPSTSWFAVDRFAFNPLTGHVIGVYKDGCIFKWHPLTDENQEVQSIADEVAISSDGKLFVTNDSDGNIAVWSFTYMTKIYQLSAMDLVHGLSFSPEGRRFYDIRGRSVNSWEPNSLIRFSETEESLSNSRSEGFHSSSLTHTSEARITQYEAVSALAITRRGNFYCVGSEDGIVNVHDASTGQSIELARFFNYQCISHMVWSEDQQHVAVADLSGDLLIKRLVAQSPSHGQNSHIERVLTLPRPKIDLEEHGIHQLLFSPDSNLLLVVSDDRGQVWSITDTQLIVSHSLEPDNLRQWLQHPDYQQLILGFGSEDVVSCRWEDLTEVSRFSYLEGTSHVDNQLQLDDDPLAELERLNLTRTKNWKVIKAILAQDDKHFIVQIQETTAQGSISKKLLIFETQEFVRGHKTAEHSLVYQHIPPEAMMRIEMPLGILSGGHFAFLDQDLWLCTIKLDAMHHDDAVKRHYFIPRDWTTTESLDLACMMADGTLLCPKDDQVAVVEYSFGNVRL